MNSSPGRPVVSICCITFQHEAFIAEALEGFLMQRTTFPFEVIVHDDASTDGTARIVAEYAARHPDIVRPIYQHENQYSKEFGRVTAIMREAARGEFIALCEGDDAWTDPTKLQAQVEHLRAHPDRPLCFTNAWNLYPDGRKQDYLRAWLDGRVPGDTVDIREIVKHNFIPTASVLYRRSVLDGFTPEVLRLTSWDWLLMTAMATRGPLGYLDRITCFRRLHQGGSISMKPYLRKLDWNLGRLDDVDVITEHGFVDVTDARRAELCVTAVQHAVDRGQPALGRPYLWRLWSKQGLRGNIELRVLMRMTLQVLTPWFARFVHRLRS